MTTRAKPRPDPTASSLPEEVLARIERTVRSQKPDDSRRQCDLADDLIALLQERAADALRQLGPAMPAKPIRIAMENFVRACRHFLSVSARNNDRSLTGCLPSLTLLFTAYLEAMQTVGSNEADFREVVMNAAGGCPSTGRALRKLRSQSVGGDEVIARSGHFEVVQVGAWTGEGDSEED